MPYCAACGSQVSTEHKFCGSCGAVQGQALVTAPQEASPVALSLKTPTNASGFDLNALRLVSVGIAVCCLGWIIYSGDVGWALLLAPLLLASVLPLAQRPRWNGWVEDWKAKLQCGVERTKAKPGKFARFVSSPLYRGCLLIWTLSEGIDNQHLKAAVRVGTSLYFIAIASAVILFVGYIVAVVVIGIAVFGFSIWFAFKIMSGPSTGHVDYDSGDAAPSWSPGMMRSAAQSRPTTDFFGNPKSDIIDKQGNKIGEVRPGTDFFGNPREGVFNSNGEKVGERRPTTDFFGDPKTDEINKEGDKVGSSNPDQDVFGNTVEKHYNEAGDFIGESRREADIFGNPVVKHTWKGEDS